MHVHNVIKIMYSNMGYLPNYPYHLISDREMFTAFIKEDGFFDEYYPCPEELLREPYNVLRESIVSKIDAYLEDDSIGLPDWIYSYMLKQVVTFDSPEEDIAYICELSNIEVPQIIAVFTEEVAEICFEISTKWLKKMAYKHIDRPPTMFGEPHVIKSLRIDEANVLLDIPSQEQRKPDIESILGGV